MKGRCDICGERINAGAFTHYTGVRNRTAPRSHRDVLAPASLGVEVRGLYRSHWIFLVRIRPRRDGDFTEVSVIKRILRSLGVATGMIGYFSALSFCSFKMAKSEFAPLWIAAVLLVAIIGLAVLWWFIEESA